MLSDAVVGPRATVARGRTVLPAVSALFSVAPLRVDRLCFVQRMQPYVGHFCAALARMRKSYRLVRTEELDRVAGTVLHGGIVALAQPRLLPCWIRSGLTS